MIPQFAGQANNHYLLKMPLHTTCLEEYTYRNISAFNKGPLRSELLLKFADEIKSSLDQMHNLGLYHCDIKPGNILISLSGNVLICDLGSVSRYGEPLKSSYNLPLDLLTCRACKMVDYMLLVTTVLEMLGCDVAQKTMQNVSDYVQTKVSDENLKSFLEKLLY